MVGARGAGSKARITADSPKGPRVTSRPRASKTADTPVCAARAKGSPSSTALSRAAAKCCQGPAVMPNQASFVTFTIQLGRRKGMIRPVKITS